MTAFSRRGACPALSRPMQTGDGLLVRLNPVAGGFSPNTLIGLAESALRHGNGVMEVTARGSLQIRGLTPDSASLLAAEVDALGIAARTGVPVETGPLTGLDPLEIRNPLPLAQSVREVTESSRLGDRLGPKVSVIIDGGGQLTMDDVPADIRFVALNAERWLLSLAGDARTATRIGALDESRACEATRAILQAIAERGREARARDLSPPQMRKLVEDWIDPDESNHEPSALTRSPVGVLAGLNENSVVGIGLPFGSAEADALAALCRQAASAGAGEIRLAQQRALLILGLPLSACMKFQRSAAALGFIVDADDPRRRIAACPGAPACASGHIASRQIAGEIARISGGALDGLFLHVSGCAKGCAHPGPAPLTLVGYENGKLGLILEGTARDAPSGYAPGEALTPGFRRMAAALQPGENFTTCLTRLGKSRAAAFFQQG